MAEAYGTEGREAYIRTRFSFDLIWPIVYTFFLLTSISWLSQKTLSSASPLQSINLLPWLAFSFDLLENISTSLVMYRYPQITPLVDILAPILSAIKWVLVSGNFLLLIALIVYLVCKKLFAKHN
jgi:hypothetical protein